MDGDKRFVDHSASRLGSLIMRVVIRNTSLTDLDIFLFMYLAYSLGPYLSVYLSAYSCKIELNGNLAKRIHFHHHCEERKLVSNVNVLRSFRICIAWFSDS